LEQKHEARKLAVSQSVGRIFGIIMVVLFICMGTTIIIKGPEMRNIPQDYATIFGVILILYGFFRGYKLYRKYFSAPEA
jgi:hypothetical protein